MGLYCQNGKKDQGLKFTDSARRGASRLIRLPPGKKYPISRSSFSLSLMGLIKAQERKKKKKTRERGKIGSSREWWRPWKLRHRKRVWGFTRQYAGHAIYQPTFQDGIFLLIGGGTILWKNPHPAISYWRNEKQERSNSFKMYIVAHHDCFHPSIHNGDIRYPVKEVNRFISVPAGFSLS